MNMKSIFQYTSTLLKTEIRLFIPTLNSYRKRRKRNETFPQHQGNVNTVLNLCHGFHSKDRSNWKRYVPCCTELTYFKDNSDAMINSQQSRTGLCSKRIRINLNTNCFSWKKRESVIESLFLFFGWHSDSLLERLRVF